MIGIGDEFNQRIQRLQNHRSSFFDGGRGLNYGRVHNFDEDDFYFISFTK